MLMPGIASRILGLSKSRILCCSQDVKSRLQAVVQGKSSINETFVEEVILTRAAAGIANRLRSVLRTFQSKQVTCSRSFCSDKLTHPSLAVITLQWRQAYGSFSHGWHNHGDDDTSAGEQCQQTGEWHLKNSTHNHPRATHKRDF